MKRNLYATSVIAMAVGMALVYAGVVTKGVFKIGTVLIAVGIVIAGAAAVIDLVTPDTPREDTVAG